MTPPDDRRGRQRALVGVMIIVATVGVLVAVGLSALRLGGITTDLTSIRTSSDTVASSNREALRLEQMVTALGDTTDGRAVAVQAGLLQRQLIVSAAAFPPDAAPARELRDVQQVLAAFPWDGLPATGGHDDPRRLSALGLVMGTERRIDAVRVEQEKQFYLATTAVLEGSRRSQLGLSALVGLVLALGVAGVTVVTSRSRSRIATAYDALHRVLLLDRLRGALAAGTTVAVILIDLDGFKNVNDTLGHPAGDELLRSAAQRLLGCVRPEDTTARLGGDEFAVLTDGGPQVAQTVGRRIVEALRRPFGVVGHEVRIGASVGVAHGDAREAAEDLLRDADIAMYVAKNAGKNRVEVFEPAMRVRAAERTGLQQELARAVECTGGPPCPARATSASR